MKEDLKKIVFDANISLVKNNLIILTWGNVSGIDRNGNIVAIKPSGVDYDKMTPEDIVLVDLDGNIVEGNLRPSSDLPTHLEIYKAWPSVNGVVHTHSPYATSFAQALLPIPCFGTTHADHFHGDVPLTRPLTREEVENDYELNTGKVIIESFSTQNLDHDAFPGILVANHGPFTWGNSPTKAVQNAVALEQIAQMAMNCKILNPNLSAVPNYILDKHYYRKHGANAYYGQK